ncbi:hypothetical protein AMK68_02635 [candidate division KD3-62 bacterium DG_56]|uniref:Uncharacterized protein n=1 Tax=candidate division KD3-62 bacterium DG_56 TaxID=1704032 RepID=A0A0S7XP75_9BACT|nr:MAG: hypothetical protein AMK68_02635 [candidate division KD3-62 bacterium DG_56]
MLREAWPIILGVLEFSIILLLLFETRQYFAGRSLISRRQYAIRMIGGLLMLVLVAALFIGIYVLDLTSQPPRPVAFLVFVGVCLVLLFGLMFMAVADAKAVEKRQSEAEGRLWRDFLLQIARLEGRMPDQPDAAAEDDGAPPARPDDDETGDPLGGEGAGKDQS